MIKRYEKYRPSGIEWIGEIPTHWKRAKLKHLVSIKITDGPHETPEFLPEGIPFLSAEAIKDNKLDFNYKRGNISRKLFEEYNKKSAVKRNDILFCKSGSTTGKSAMVETDSEFGIWSPLAIIRAAKQKIQHKYLFYFIQSREFQTQVQVFWSFGTQPNIGMSTLENLFVTYSTKIEEQVAIANYLDEKTAEIDDFIAKKQKLIKLLSEERTSIINQLISGDGKKWRKIRLKYLVTKVGSGITPTGGATVYLKEGIPLLRSQNIYSDGLALDDLAFISEEIDQQMSNSKIQEGDVLLNITGASIGRCYFVPVGFGRGNVNQHVCIIRPVQTKIKTEYLHSFLISDLGQTLIEVCQNGANREGLNFQQIKSFEIPLPTINEQEELLHHIRTNTKKVDDTISKIEKEIEMMQEYRTTLISEVITGKIKVI